MPMFARRSRRYCHRSVWLVILMGLVGGGAGLGWSRSRLESPTHRPPSSAAPAPAWEPLLEASEGRDAPTAKGVTGLGLGAALGLVLLKLGDRRQRPAAPAASGKQPSLLAQYLQERQLPPDVLCSSDRRLTPLQREILQGLLVLGATQALPDPACPVAQQTFPWWDAPAHDPQILPPSARPPRQPWRYGEVRSRLLALGFSEEAIAHIWQIVGTPPPGEDISQRA